MASYGGDLRYTVLYQVPFPATLITPDADVTMHGNGRRYYAKHFQDGFAGAQTEAVIPLVEV